MLWVETIVCSAKRGSGARLRRMLLARQEFKRRQDGCVGAWVGRGAEDGMMLLVQSVFQSANHWKTISDSVKATFDVKDGGLESLLLGPPLVGIFEIPPEELQSLVFSS